MKYEDWLKGVPESLKQDPLWQFNLYPKTLFLYDLVWEDCERLLKDVRGTAIAKQIIRSGGSICANIEEGSGAGSARSMRISCGRRLARHVKHAAGIIARAACCQLKFCNIACNC